MPMITVHIVILKSVNNLRATVFEAGRYAWGLCHDNMLLEAGARKEPIGPLQLLLGRHRV